MKNTGAALKTRIRQEVTSLCTCLAIKRRDGRVYYFTDHDVAVTVDVIKYSPVNSFKRSSVLTTIEMEVDQLEVEGILNSEAVSRDDVAARLFDFSEVEFFAVDWEMPQLGRVMLRRGWLGEVTTNENGSFTAELRGLTQVFTYRVGDAYSPECRADLGDKSCKFPISPPRWKPGYPYRKGDFVLGAVTAADDFVNIGLTNPSFEDDATNVVIRNPTGWVSYGDDDSRWVPKTSAFGALPKVGTKFIVGTRANSGVSPTDVGMYQDIDLPGAGISTATLDTGLCRLYMAVWCAVLRSGAYARVRAHVIDVDAVVTTIFDTGRKVYAEDRFIQERAKDVLIPAGTRKLRIDLFSHKDAGVEEGAAFDGVTCSINLPEGTYEDNDQFGGVVFKALTGGTSGATEPVFSALVDATYTDGTVTWICHVSPSETDEVSALNADPKKFVPTSLANPAGWYDGGLLTWETGRNAGHTQEIKTWAGGIVSLFQRPYYQPAIGDRYVIRPGCDRRFSTCSDKFDNVINFRGEPNVPGQDEYYKTPNAQTSG